eukprot:TRINITY_DN14937_c0_g1_i1.p1 TRINITY_DN14937_c0_g1~~TRINITY_DN14937_c0_g1_i1.p1  ORF type:complete len:500 (-),score=206.21 TRINITY_DN14937_c0_g1_i1:58-1557(-)
MMLATPRKPKRIGGAPFSPAPGTSTSPAVRARAAAVLKKDAPVSLSARLGRIREAALASTMPLSARGPSMDEVGSAVPSQTRGISAVSSQQRARSEDGRQSSPCTTRAEQYVRQLVGVPEHEQGGQVPTREWTLVQELDTMDQLAKESAKMREAKQKRLKHLADLNVQQEERQQQKDRLKDVQRRWRQEAEDDAARYRAEMEERKERKFENLKRFNEEQREQLEFARQRDRKEKQAEQQAELDMVAAMLEGKRREDEKMQKLKQRRKEEGLEMQRQARVAQQRKAEAKATEHQREIEMARQAREIVEKQERQRQEKINAMKEKQAKQLAAYEVGIGNQLEMQAKEAEERARKASEELAEKDRLTALGRQQRQQVLMAASKAAVASQLKEQEAFREAEKQKDQELHALQKKKALNDAEADKVKEDKRKQAVLENAEFLKKQMREKAQKTNGKNVDRMDEVEKRINKEMLSRAMDPERPDGLQLLLKKKRMEYRAANKAAY